MSDPLQAGNKLGPYRLLTPLGRGGMASVWVAVERSRQSGRQRLVAVKAMLPSLAQRPQFRSMFLDEGQIVRSIDHPNVVRVYDVGEEHGVLFMGMEWVEGDALNVLIREARRRRAIPPEIAVRMIADVAAGLHEAHELRGWDGELRGLVHCDVSPQNILLGVEGQVKLVDFGVARAVALSDAPEGVLLGKYSYASPEQSRCEPIDRRSDVFSLGIVLFELTTGERLFRGRDATDSLHLVQYGRVPRPSQLLPGYPPRLERIVLQALERDVSRRYQTADAFRAALEEYLVGARIVVSAAGVGTLLKRVLGARINERRQQIRLASEALRREDMSALAAQGVPVAEGELTASIPSGEIEISEEGEYGADTASTSTTLGTASQLRPLSISLSPAAPEPRRRRWVAGVASLAAAIAVASAWVVAEWSAAPSAGAPSIGATAAPASASGSARVPVSGSDEDAVSAEALPLATEARASPPSADPKAPSLRPRASMSPEPVRREPEPPRPSASPRPRATGKELGIENPYR